MTTRNPAASVRARLLNKARADGVDFQLLLTRDGLERLLYRLSVSRERDNFLLKGALLFDLWYDVPLRPTRDIDLLGFGLAEIPLLIAAIEGICAIEVDDGMAGIDTCGRNPKRGQLRGGQIDADRHDRRGPLPCSDRRRLRRCGHPCAGVSALPGDVR